MSPLFEWKANNNAKHNRTKWGIFSVWWGEGLYCKKKKKREDFYSNAGFRTLKSYFPVELDYTMKGANLRDEFTC